MAALRLLPLHGRFPEGRPRGRCGRPCHPARRLPEALRDLRAALVFSGSTVCALIKTGSCKMGRGHRELRPRRDHEDRRGRRHD
eukprot:232455-Pyramimonas_sp.AAC.1